jgi:hypothetical protein
MDVAVTFAEDEDAAKQHIQEIRKKYKPQGDGGQGACVIVQQLLSLYGIT